MSIQPLLEAYLLMATEPVTVDELARVSEAPVDVVIAALGELQAFYRDHDRGFELREVAGGWRYWTRPEHAARISAHLVEGQSAKLSRAALETLAVIAYQQPIARSRIAAVRGVNVDGVVRTLVLRGLVVDVGRDEGSGAMLFGTTDDFLARMGLRSLDDLPPLAPNLPDAGELEAELTRLAELEDTDGHQ